MAGRYITKKTEVQPEQRAAEPDPMSLQRIYVENLFKRKYPAW